MAGNKNAKVIIPFALATWLISALLTREGTPEVARGAFAIAFAVAVPLIVFYLMADLGWRTLATRYRARMRFTGAWRPYPTAAMAHVSVDDPEYRRNQMRFLGGTLRLGTSDEALHLSMLFSKVPLLGRFFPEVRIPWSAVTSARTYEAPGWFTPASSPGALVQAAYDPNYRGRFVELVVGEPPVFLQLPADLLGERVLARLPLADRAG